MKHSVKLAAALAGLLALGAGCAGNLSGPPCTVDQYDQARAAGGRANYPRQTILLYNLQRVTDSDLELQPRINSLNLVARLGGDEPVVLEQLASVLSNPSNPPDLQREVLEFLLRKNYPELTQYVIKVLPHVKANGPMRDVLMEWLTRHPTVAVLSEVVHVWGDAQPANAADEAYFQQIVERLSGKTWDQALLDGLNTAGFTARGSAIEILARRVPIATLRPRILAMSARTDTVTVVQTFLKTFNYLPSTVSELLTSAYIYKARQDVMPEVAYLANKWRDEYGYRFNIRDFHLLSRLSHDPRRVEVTRAQLISDLAGSLAKRRHIKQGTYRAATQQDLSIRFDKQVDKLSMVDLWNLYLLNDMLSRSQIQAAFATVSGSDREDRRYAWGGQVFYDGPQARATRYPPDAQVKEDDLTYNPSIRSLADGRDALCRFHDHFEKLQNADRAGPTAEELADCKRGNYYALVLTSLGETSFCAHYYNPQGVVISLGEFPFAK
ncbi:MAG: hypothetical protein WC869_07050 [Phycisphaerae bacterium]|jgi:hypothetical protein